MKAMSNPFPSHDLFDSSKKNDRIDTIKILDAMEAELNRSMAGMRISGSPRPYFMLFSLLRSEVLGIRSAYGSLAKSRASTNSSIFVDIRVGNHRFDNIVDGGLSMQAEERESADWIDAPDDLDPEALRIAFWKLTQLRFDEALQDYFDHRKAMVAEYLRDEQESFSREQPCIHIEQLHDVAFPRKQWEEILVLLSKRFFDYPDIYDPSMSITMERRHRWLTNSEGSRVITEDVYVEARVEAWVLNEEGVYLDATRSLSIRDLKALPSFDQMEQMTEEVIQELQALRNAKSPGSFVGPALFSGQAASTMFHEALGHRLEGERLVARGETRTFAHKLGEQILPKGINIYDDPTMTDSDGRPLWGSYKVDDEGVPAQRAHLVRDGILCGFLCSRSPTIKSTRSNGHGRHDSTQRPMARMGNFIVEAEPKASQSWDKLCENLITLTRKQGKKHGLVIQRIQSGETSTSSYDFQVFKGQLAEVYLVDVESRAWQRIQDVELIGTPLSALQRIVGFGGSPGTDYGFCYAESGSIPVGGIAPAVLLSEVELQQKSTSGFHEPLIPPHYADDGSRGRVPDFRKRGRRRRSIDDTP